MEGASPHVHASRAWRHERLPRAVPSRSGGPGGAVEVAIVGFDVSEDEDGGRTKRMRMGGSEGARSPDDGSGRRSGKRSRHVVTLASSMPAVTRFVSCARCKLWWMTPAWGVATDQIPAETQFLVLELDAGKAGYVVLVPMISPEGFRVTLSGHANEGGGRLCMVAESNCDAVVTDAVEGALAIAASSSPFEAVEAAVAAAAAHMGTFGLRVDKSPPPIVDVFGWCTWDAFYHQVTPDGIESGVASLADGGTPARFVIVDDGWQSVLPDAVFKKKVDHISGVPAAPPQSRLAEEEASGGWMTRAGSSVASGLESMYWHGLHSTPYGSYSWHALRILGQYCLSPAIRAAVSTLSCFNHRVSRIEANVKFQFASGGRTSKDKRRGTASGGDGLRHVVSRIKQLGVHHVYCWHALFGYWGGLHPAEPGVAKYNPKLKTPAHSPGVLTVEPSQAWDPITLGGVGVVAPEKLGQFYEELHSYLAASGVDGIKVDGQAMVGGLGQGEGGGPALAKRLHGALEASAARHFPTNGLINCMCHSNENILNFSGSALARVSDDFYPNNDASHTVHIANVAYNSVFMVGPSLWRGVAVFRAPRSDFTFLDVRSRVPRCFFPNPSNDVSHPLPPRRVLLCDDTYRARWCGRTGICSTARTKPASCTPPRAPSEDAPCTCRIPRGATTLTSYDSSSSRLEKCCERPFPDDPLATASSSTSPRTAPPRSRCGIRTAAGASSDASTSRARAGRARRAFSSITRRGPPR